MLSASQERLRDGAICLSSVSPAFRRNLVLATAVGLAALFTVGPANAGGGTTTNTITTVCPSNPTTKPNTTTTNVIGTTVVTNTVEGGGTCSVSSVSTTTPGPNSTAIIGAVQADIEDIREQKRRKYRAKYRALLGYAPESTTNAGGVMRFTSSDSKPSDPIAPLGVLGYASTKASKIATKKSDAEEEAAEPDIESAVWTHGSFEHENQTGTFGGSDISLKTRSWSGLAGADWTKTLPSETYATFGVFGGQTTTYLAAPTGASATINGPSAGIYLMYFAGDFSADVTYTHAWLINKNNNVASVFNTSNGVIPLQPGYMATTSVSTTTPLATATNFDHVEGNLNYRFNLANNWWFEPTFKASFLYLTESQGNQDEQIVHLEGGARVGTSFNWGDVKVEPQLAGLVMSDVLVAGGGPFGGPAIETDQGQIWGKGVGKVNFVWTKAFSTCLEAQVYGTGGVENTIGYKFAVEARYKF
jgi:hypothetical protein